MAAVVALALGAPLPAAAASVSDGMHATAKVNHSAAPTQRGGDQPEERGLHIPDLPGKPKPSAPAAPSTPSVSRSATTGASPAVTERPTQPVAAPRRPGLPETGIDPRVMLLLGALLALSGLCVREALRPGE